MSIQSLTSELTKKVSIGMMLVILAVPQLSAQDLEPRAYTNIPVGMNFMVLGTGYTAGAVLFDPTVPLDNAKISINGALAGYVRTLKIGRMSGKVDVIVPYAWLSGSADFNGQRLYREVNGFGDIRVGMSVNFIGAPGLRLAEFKDYKQKLVVGATMRVFIPLSQYDPSRLVNIGTNRFAFRPEIGVSKKFGRLFMDAAGGVTLYTVNQNYYINRTMHQLPVYFVQGHMIYTFKKGIWVALDGTYYWGGSTVINEVRGNNLQENTRAGITVAMPLNLHQSLKLNLSTGVTTRTGTDFNVILLAWQYRWGHDLKKTNLPSK